MMRTFYCMMIALALLIIPTFLLVMYLDRPSVDGWASAGQRGDFIGGHLSAAASLTAAGLFFVAILLQRDELREQRNELKLSREIANKQAKEMEQQTLIAERSVVITQILEIYQLIVRAWIDSQRAGRQIPRTLDRARQYVDQLLESELLNDIERGELRKLVLEDWSKF
jgi:hypothetical protein